MHIDYAGPVGRTLFATLQRLSAPTGAHQYLYRYSELLRRSCQYLLEALFRQCLVDRPMLVNQLLYRL